MLSKRVLLCLSLSFTCQFGSAQQSQSEAKTYGSNDVYEVVLTAAKDGNVSALSEIGQRYFKNNPPDYTNALKWLQKAAELGDSEAQYILARCYNNGFGVQKNGKEAFSWATKAVEKGHVNAQNILGVCYLNGSGVDKDEAEAVKWFRKAAEQGFALAQVNLGDCYLDGKGVAKDETEAVKWYRKAAEQGNARAQFNMGSCYFGGKGVSKDEAETVKWYRKAAEQGDARAQFNMGYCYFRGKGVFKDEVEAVKWYRKAAEQGNALAQANLGSCYSVGEGVAEDKVEAFKWFKKAADQGSAWAQVMVAFGYVLGDGVTEDEAEAIKWFQKAAEQGHSLAQEKCKKYGVKWKISAADEIEEVDEKRLGELKAKAEALKLSTVVFKSLYLGMPIQDAAALLRYYMEKGGSVKAPPIVLQNYAEGRWFKEEESGIRATASADGKVTAIYLPKKAVDIMFDTKGVEVKSFIKTFQSSYSLGDFRYESPSLEFFSHNSVVGKMDGIQPIASKLGMQDKWTTTSQQGYSITVYGSPVVFEERKLRELVFEGTVETIPSGSILVRKINTAAFD